MASPLLFPQFICSVIFFSLLALASGCRQQIEQSEALPIYAEEAMFAEAPLIYRFAVHPLSSPKRVFAAYQPLINFINARLNGFQIKLVTPRDYAAFEQRLYSAGFDFALANPLQACESLKHGYQVLGKMGDGHKFRGLIITRRDASCPDIRYLTGRPLSFPAPTSFAGTILPKAFLQAGGLDLSENPIRYVGSDGSAIMDVYFGKTVAAGTWALPWELFCQEHPDIAASLQVQWATRPFVTNAVLAKASIPERHARQLMDVLLTLPKTKPGQTALSTLRISCFEHAENKEYLSIDSFIRSGKDVYAPNPKPHERIFLEP